MTQGSLAQLRELAGLSKDSSLEEVYLSLVEGGKMMNRSYLYLLGRRYHHRWRELRERISTIWTLA